MGVDDIAVETDRSADRMAPTFDLVQTIVRMLEPLSTKDQRHVLKTVTTWLRLGEAPPEQIHYEGSAHSQPPDRIARKEEYPFSGRAEISPKEFLLEKDPKTDVERLACLAYYLTHYRDQPYFKTEDLSKLNIDAAQRAFSNASFSANNASRDGFFVAAPKKGSRQLSALGEQYVQALPDHEAARELRKRMFGRRTSLNRGKRGGSTRADVADK